MRVFWLFAVALCVVPVAQAQIYGGRDMNGAIVLSNFRSAVADEILIATPEPPALAQVLAAMPDSRFASLISRVALDNALSPQLLHAVIAVESDFDARAVSRKGALGLMQLMPQTARQLGVRDPFDPAQNIAAGAAHLK